MALRDEGCDTRDIIIHLLSLTQQSLHCPRAMLFFFVHHAADLLQVMQHRLIFPQRRLNGPDVVVDILRVHCLIGRTTCDTLDSAADLFAGLQNARIGVTERR